MSQSTAGPPVATGELNLFSYVQRLAGDLANNLELPGFPDVVMRLHRTLGDEKAGAKDIVRLVSSEPALAARLLQLANSAAFNATEKAVSELRTAVTLLGFNLVRSTATTFAMKQLEQQAWLEPIRPHLARIWADSTSVAAICYVGSRHIEGTRPDEALAAGLFHQLGGLYVLTRAHREGVALGNDNNWADAIADWHPAIGRAILETWGMPAHLVEAVESQNGLDDNPAGMPLLARLLASGKVYRRVMAGAEASSAEAVEADKKLLETITFGTTPWLAIVGPAHAEIEKVRQVIGR